MDELTDRDLELAEIALHSAAQSCQSGASLRNQKGLDPLAREYLLAKQRIERLRESKPAQRIWLVIEVSEFQGAVELERVVGVFDDEAAAHRVAITRGENAPELEFRVQGWPMNDTIA